MNIVRASSKFQITIPKQLRNKLGINAGQRFTISDRDGMIILTPLPTNPIDFLCGALKGEPSLSDELRS